MLQTAPGNVMNSKVMTYQSRKVVPSGGSLSSSTSVSIVCELVRHVKFLGLPQTYCIRSFGTEAQHSIF